MNQHISHQEAAWSHVVTLILHLNACPNYQYFTDKQMPLKLSINRHIPNTSLEKVVTDSVLYGFSIGKDFGCLLISGLISEFRYHYRIKFRYCFSRFRYLSKIRNIEEYFNKYTEFAVWLCNHTKNKVGFCTI